MVPSALRAAGASVEIHDDHFSPDSPDESWLPVVGERGWVVLTKDRRIRYRAPALAAIGAAGVRLFVLSAGDMQGAEMGRVFADAIPKIARFSMKNRAPFIAKLTSGGSIQMQVSARAFRGG